MKFDKKQKAYIERLIRDASAHAFSLGIESGRDEVLDSIQDCLNPLRSPKAKVGEASDFISNLLSQLDKPLTQKVKK